MPGNGNTSYWLFSGIVAVFGTLFGLVTRRVNGVADSQCEHGERLATLEAHYTDLRDGQKRIERKVDTVIQRM